MESKFNKLYEKAINPKSIIKQVNDTIEHAGIRTYLTNLAMVGNEVDVNKRMKYRTTAFAAFKKLSKDEEKIALQMAGELDLIDLI